MGQYSSECTRREMVYGTTEDRVRQGILPWPGARHRVHDTAALVKIRPQRRQNLATAQSRLFVGVVTLIDLHSTISIAYINVRLGPLAARQLGASSLRRR